MVVDSPVLDFEIDHMHCDPAAEYAYAFRYSSESLMEKRFQIARALGSRGVEFWETHDGFIKVEKDDGSALSETDEALIQEMSILNTAYRLKISELSDIHSFGELFGAVASQASTLFEEVKRSKGTLGKIELHEFTTLIAPGLLQAILAGQHFSGDSLLSQRDVSALEGCQRVVSFYEKIINPVINGNVIVG